MTSKSEKLLAKLENKQRLAVLRVIAQLKAGDERGLDIKAMKGQPRLYRARVGRYRIFYSRAGGQFEFLGLSKRDDHTYRDF